VKLLKYVLYESVSNFIETSNKFLLFGFGLSKLGDLGVKRNNSPAFVKKTVEKDHFLFAFVNKNRITL